MLETIDIHPVRFNHSIPCGIRDAGYRQIVQCGDTTQFQMLIDECAGFDLITNGDFINPNPTPWQTTGSGGWTYNSFQGTYSKSLGFLGALFQDLEITNGTLLKLEFTIDSVSDPFLAVMGSNFLVAISEPGTYTYWVTALNINNLSFAATLADAAFTVSNVKLFAINTNVVVDIVNSAGVTVRSVSPSTAPQYFQFNRGFFTFSYDWLDESSVCLPDGCYYFKVSDPCFCSQGGFVGMDFDTANDRWLQGPNCLVENGVAFYDIGTLVVNPQSESIAMPNVVCPNTQYRITYEIANITSDVEVFVRVGNVNGPVHTTAGVKTDIVTTNSSTVDTSFQIFFRSTDDNQTVSIVELNFEAVERTYAFRSNWFKLYETAPCSCVVRACCDEDALMAGYGGTGFAPRVRLAAKYGQGDYPNTFRDSESSFGVKSNHYFRGRKHNNFFFVAAEYIHDFIGYLKGYDHVFIDDDEVFIENDDYTPTYEGNYDFAEGVLQVSLKKSLIEKRKCNSKVNTCSEDGQGVNISIDGGSDDGFNIVTESRQKLQTG